jgi:acetyl-CoA C-acetyltransferase
MSADPIVIAGYARTPMGGFMGALSRRSATELGAAAVRAAVLRAGIDPASIDQAIIGCALSAGLGQAPARQAALAAGLPQAVQATTVNKMCGSGLQAVILAHDAIRAGSADIIVAGGMESMSNAPYLLKKHRGGARFGHDQIFDHMALDGLEDAYDRGKSMGAFAEEVARARQVTREAMDAYAIESLTRAKAAVSGGAFAAEIVPVGDVATDEQPLKADPARIPTLKPAFAEGGAITAANASSISDGAAALVLMRESGARAAGAPIAGRIVAHAAHAHEPGLFATAPARAIRKALARAGWTASDVDLWEINEAFAVVAMLAAQDLGIDRDRLNVNGGACALGHPIGASGARILATLLAALEARNLTRGVASLCIGGGEAVALCVERA